MNARTWLRAPLALLLAANLGCGTMTSGTRQNVELRIAPARAGVSLYALDGELQAQTDDASNGVLPAPRPTKNLPFLALASAEGHCPGYQITRVDPTPGLMAEAVLLAIPFIQVIGFVAMTFDNATGGCCSTAAVEITLEEAGSCDE